MLHDMSPYFSWNEQTITDFSDANINTMYDQGYVLTRPVKGLMKQTRSLRIDLSQFELTSENRRVLKKNEQLAMSNEQLPYADYNWSIGKLAKDFYETKFGAGTFTANKVRELLTDAEKSNFNRLFVYNYNSPLLLGEGQGEVSPIGYCIAYETNKLIHYSYPFYNLKPNTYNLTPNLGLGMMLTAVLYAKEQGKKYIYLGSAQRPTDTYKLQFAGLEWFDGENWSTDTDELKNILSK